MLRTAVCANGLFHREPYIMIMCVEMFAVKNGIGSEHIDDGDDSSGSKLSFPGTQ